MKNCLKLSWVRWGWSHTRGFVYAALITHMRVDPTHTASPAGGGLLSPSTPVTPPPPAVGVGVSAAPDETVDHGAADSAKHPPVLGDFPVVAAAGPSVEGAGAIGSGTRPVLTPYLV